MNSSKNRSQLVQYWWSKALDSLSSAKRELEANEFSFAINRIYYAAFYAVSAALLERGASFKKHSGVRSAFHREFIKSGLLKVEWAKFYDRLFEDRQEGDYIALTTFEHPYVKSQLDMCAEFHKQIREFIQSISIKGS
ncbi:MAG: HEPN domain-containing protein [Melioribacteraceae bacterium]|nr:HEPN domain-containing protein [Melioribacteraceae bacterium]MCF8355875.1 HEPN domain-containing protein [Melioribacteraceae bacterium]MCF8393283.1 HEPN domain-containing protein [Melioribacteraceae bacterium]MCF8419135.1 HEPN domain-containing protein [Melioribacteraceae bacterium]